MFTSAIMARASFSSTAAASCCQGRTDRQSCALVLPIVVVVAQDTPFDREAFRSACMVQPPLADLFDHHRCVGERLINGGVKQRVVLRVSARTGRLRYRDAPSTRGMEAASCPRRSSAVIDRAEKGVAPILGAS